MCVGRICEGRKCEFARVEISRGNVSVDGGNRIILVTQLAAHSAGHRKGLVPSSNLDGDLDHSGSAGAMCVCI